MKTVLDCVTIVLLFAFILSSVAYIVFLAVHLLRPSKWSSAVTKAIIANGPSTLGLPFAALGSFTLVVALPLASDKPLKFEVGGLTVDGPSSQILFWILAFLAISVAIRLVAPPSTKPTE
ncbi:MAG: hypothetical protein H7A55_08905 [Verrucomicrobiaceae bacterium]|nr:hypothetical protein [Verrucomicrobiaceae bacterium]